MLDWIASNYATLIVAAVLAVAVGIAVWRVIRARRRGGRTCSCGCASCAYANECKKPKDTGTKKP